jgi:hypothetical protein
MERGDSRSNVVIFQSSIRPSGLLRSQTIVSSVFLEVVVQ